MSYVYIYRCVHFAFCHPHDDDRLFSHNALGSSLVELFYGVCRFGRRSLRSDVYGVVWMVYCVCVCRLKLKRLMISI